MSKKAIYVTVHQGRIQLDEPVDFQEGKRLRLVLVEDDDRDELLSPIIKTHPQTGLPYVECPHEATDEMTPERVAEILLQQEVGWHK
jgi:hypothetical protein